MTEASKKTGVFGFLKTLVAEEVPDKPSGARNTPLPPAPPVEHHYGESGGYAPSGEVARSAGPDPQALAKLESRLQGACPAPYAAFMEQYEALKEDIADERTRFKVALKTTHTTQDQITGGLDTLLGVMDSAKSEFMHSWDDNKKKRVSEADKSIASSDELIKSSEEQIKAIQEKIASLRTKHDTDVENVKEEIRRLDAIRGGFEAAHAQVVGKLTDQKNRINAMPKA